MNQQYNSIISLLCVENVIGECFTFNISLSCSQFDWWHVIYLFILECLGRSDRKVELPASVIHLAKQRTRPELAARFLIRHLFPDSILLRSNVYGAIRKGKAPLDCNKINAVRGELHLTNFDIQFSAAF